MSLDFNLEKMEVCNVYWANITHNVTKMWSKAGVYDALYNSDGMKASSIIDVLYSGLADMSARPDVYKAMAPSNGWGSYDSAMKFLGDALLECLKHPDATIRISK